MSTPSIKEQMAASLAKKSGESANDVLARMNKKDEVKRGQLAIMMEQVKSVAADAQVVKAQTRVAKRPTKDETDTRSVFALVSDSLKKVYIVLYKEYRNKTEEEAVDVARRYMKTTKKVQDLLAAQDLKAVMCAEGVQVHEAEISRLDAHNEYERLGYIVLSAKTVVESV